MDELNYYSISFEYKHAVRGISAPGIHISYYVDERKESDKLSKALNFVCDTLYDLRLDSRSEYCFPDGSLFRYVRTEYGIIELSMILRSRLKGMKFEIVPLPSLYPAHYGSGESLEEFFSRVPGERAYRKKALMKFVANFVIAAGAI